MDEPRVPELALKKFVEAVLQKLGVTQENASLTAEVIVEADLRGINSHGTKAFEARVKDIENGKIVVTALPKLIKRVGATALFDGQHGYGPLLCASVLKTTIDLAKEHGIGMVLLKNSSHWGCPAFYSRWMAKNGFIGIGITNTNPAMPLWGSAVKSVGNNPLTIAAPRRDHEPIVLDMAMQQVSWGGLQLAKAEGKKLPELWGFDTSGKATDDPAEIIESGRVRPVGDYKGSGLAFMLEIVTGVLSSGLINSEVGEQTAAGQPAHYSQTFLAIKPDNFIDRDYYFDKIEKLYETAKDSTLADGFSEILLPGDRSNTSLSERKREGIPVKHMRQAIEQLSNAYQIPIPWN